MSRISADPLFDDTTTTLQNLSTRRRSSQNEKSKSVNSKRDLLKKKAKSKRNKAEEERRELAAKHDSIALKKQLQQQQAVSQGISSKTGKTHRTSGGRHKKSSTLESSSSEQSIELIGNGNTKDSGHKKGKHSESKAASTAPKHKKTSSASDKKEKKQRSDDGDGVADGGKKKKGSGEKAKKTVVAAATADPADAAPPLPAEPVTKKGKKTGTGASAGAASGNAAKPLFADLGTAEDMNKAFKGSMEDGFTTVAEFGGPDRAYMAVYDGHSGRAAVDHVMANLHPCLLARLQKKPQSVQKAFEHAYDQIDNQIKDLNTSSGTTAVTALIERSADGSGRRILHVANVGDARAVIVAGTGKKQKVTRLSYDHKISDPAERKRCEDMGGVVLFNRLQGQVLISRALGDWDIKPYCCSEPFYSRLDLDAVGSPSYSYLLLACDGVFDVFSDEQAMAEALKHREFGPAVMAEKLIESSIAAGSKDNLTVLICKL